MKNEIARDDDIPYLSLQDNEMAVAVDDSRLKELGYKQELRRKLSAVSNFAVTFSIISVLTGITTMFGTGLTFGGPLTMVYGWPIAGFFTLIVGFSMAEICSSYPTSGGLYFWSAKLCGNDWAPFASWLTGWYVFLPLPSFTKVIILLHYNLFTAFAL
ncbi:Mitochondrial branched-chain amino acid (BCAA) aminotransferase [Ranunculus cassubicifolius]